MKRCICLVTAMLLWVVTVSAQAEVDVKTLVADGTYEASTMPFGSIEGSAEFIKKFSLNLEEKSLIGIWGLDIYQRQLDSDWYGPGPAIIFFPNRLYVAVSSIRAKTETRYFVGEWKVENGVLWVNFKARIQKAQDGSMTTPSSLVVERKQVNTYFSIFRVPKYSEAFVNNEPFDWSSVPEEYRLYYQINPCDAPRFRILFDTFGIPPGNLSLIGQQGELLMAKTDSDEYYLKLITIW